MKTKNKILTTGDTNYTEMIEIMSHTFVIVFMLFQFLSKSAPNRSCLCFDVVHPFCACSSSFRTNVASVSADDLAV